MCPWVGWVAVAGYVELVRPTFGLDGQAAFRAVDYDAHFAVATLPFEGRVIARPSMLVGNRADLGHPVRQGEVLAAALGKAVGILIPANDKPINASAVAKALLADVPSARGRTVLLSGSMRRDQAVIPHVRI